MVPIFSGIYNALQNYLKVLSESKLVYLITAAIIIVEVASTAILIIEQDVPGAKITNIGESLWWALATVTTVGYGDIVPITMWGRIVGAILMLVGLAFMMTFISVLGSKLVDVRFGVTDQPSTKSSKKVALKNKRRNQLDNSYTQIQFIKEKIDSLDDISEKDFRYLLEMIEEVWKKKNVKNDNSTEPS